MKYNFAITSEMADVEVPTIQGSCWQFDGSKSTVEFLAGGIVHYNDSEDGGHWNQDGEVVTFDSNKFTMFAVTVKGDRMSGIWYRMHDPKDNCGTGLRRIR